MANKAKAVLKAQTNEELLSYIINVTPELRAEIDLPVQGEGIVKYGQLIMSNERYKNAFLNTINLIGLTVIKRNAWENPWDFTNRGELNYGQQIREIILDLCNVYDYNQNFSNKQQFLKTAVPNLFQYLHEVNFQKYYETTTSDAQMAMAFTNEDLFTFIEEAVSMLYESWQYDKYITDKYMLCRRLLDGTITTNTITNFDTNTSRENVSAMKNVSDLMTFRSPNYNPAGIRRATSYDDQIAIVNTQFNSKITTEVLATSFFRNDADMKIRLALIDGFDNHDDARLKEVLGDGYIPFTESELTQLKNVPAVIISREWFMDYNYAFDNQAPTKRTDFFNPTTLERNHFLHVWAVFSTSPFENAAAFIKGTPSVNSITLSPATSTVSRGGSVQLDSTVVTENFANKAVVYSVSQGDSNYITVNQNGKITIASDYPLSEQTSATVVITATSVFDSTKTGTATITVV